MTKQDFRGFYKSQFPDGGLFVDFQSLCRVFGMKKEAMREAIVSLGIDFCRPAKRKLYNVEDVFSILNQTKYRQ